MRNLGPVAAAFIAVGFAGAAEASDLRVRSAPSVFSPAPISSWSGLYVGLNGGGGWGTTNHTASGMAGSSGDFDVGGGLFGGTIGYNMQMGPWVFGGEADLDWADIDGSTTTAFGGASATFTSTLDWVDTVRGRVGYLVGPGLLYVTGGAAYGSVRAKVSGGAGAGFAGFAGQSDTRLGWVFGVGYEYMLWRQLSGKLEYLYVDLGTNTQLLIDNVKFNTNILRVGANWHF